MSKKNNKILMVAFHYPPDNSSTGVLRTLKFSNYLPDYSWQPYVLTVPGELYSNIDKSLEKQISAQVKVTRVSCYDAKDRWSIAGHYPIWTAIPDRYRSWKNKAAKKGAELIRQNNINVIYSTYPLPTAHLVGLKIKKATNLPWVADFRDPWAGGGGTGWLYTLDKWYEKRVVANADIIIANTALSREDFIERYPWKDPGAIITIPNGYDESDFSSLPSVKVNQDVFTVVYPGTIDEYNRNPAPLFEAIAELINSNKLDKSRIKITLLGSGPSVHHEWFIQLVEKCKLEDVLEVIENRIPYHESLVILSNAGLLVVLNEPIGDKRNTELNYSRLMIPAKVYEYIRLNRPILALCGEGAVPRILEELQAGWWVSPMNFDKIVSYVKQAADAHFSGEVVAIPQDKIKSFERSVLTSRLADVLNKLV